jgi:signal transduction histidine kinase
MKLKQIGVILLGSPLACQLLLGTLLIVDLNQLDAAANREANAKSVIGSCVAVRGAIAKYTLFLGAQRFESSEDSTARLQQLSTLVDTQLGTLKSQVKGDPQSEEDVRFYGTALNKLLELFADASTQYAGGQIGSHVARFVNEAEYLEELTASYKETQRCESDLIDHYSPVEDEFRPKAIREREAALKLVIAGVILNAIVVIVLAASFGRVTLTRLDQLMKNISKFSKGDLGLDPISGGNDEISELDREFRNMAEARQNAEQFRRSLYAMVSHDLRSPLTSASLTLSTVLEKERQSLNPPTLKKLERLNHETSRLVKLANSFLDLEQAESGTLELHKTEANVVDLFDGAVNAVKGMSDAKRIEIETNAAAATVVCDADRIVQVLVNLISNSIRYAPRESTIKVTFTRANSSARFEIEDKGSGVPESERAKLFTRFAQIAEKEKQEGSSSGLGLYICKLLIDAHGGQIGMEPPAGGGSRFWFELPQA